LGIDSDCIKAGAAGGARVEGRQEDDNQCGGGGDLHREVDQAVKKHRMRSERPGVTPGAAQAGGKGGEQDCEKRKAAFGRPFRPVVVRVIDPLARIETCVGGVNRFKGSKSEAGQGTLADHAQSGRE
jgi:hypothetical protein